MKGKLSSTRQLQDNSSMDNLAAIFSAVPQRLGVGFEVHAEQAHA